MKALLGGLLGVLILGYIGYVLGRRWLRRVSREVLGTADVSQLASLAAQAAREVDNSPKSLNGADSILLPRILEDFPDFDVELVKTYARDALKEKLKSKSGLHIYNVVISKYDRAAIQKSVLLQAALSWKEGGVLCQKRYCLRYAYVVKGAGSTVAANCPNCGSPISYGQTTCEYCGSRLTGIMKAAWQFTEIYEG